MPQLKGVIFGWDNVLVRKGDLGPQAAILKETGKLVRFLHEHGIEIVVATNHQYEVTDEETKEVTPSEDYFEEKWGVPLDVQLLGQDGGAGKQSRAGLGSILASKGWSPNNTIFVGNSTADMQAAVNNKILLLTAKWYPDTPETTGYGFMMPNPKELARFIDVFCLRDRFWYFQIDHLPVEMYALAPLNTFIDTNKYHCNNFLANVKNQLAGDDEFWARFLATSTYFTGLYDQIDYITAYPKHTAGEYQQVLIRPMDTFAKSFNKRYIPDLIERHTTAPSSREFRELVTHATQLDTIKLRALPTRIVKDDYKEYASFPIKAGKTVLVIDDVCTKGMAFEAARSYLKSLGIRVVSVTFLKTPRSDYGSIADVTLPNGPFRKNTVTDLKLGKSYGYFEHIVDPKAPAELTERLKKYLNWNWPSGI